MIIKIPVNASPFPLSFLNVQESTFRIEVRQSRSRKGEIDSMHGTGSDLNKNGALYASMGEYFERVSQSRPSHKIKKNYIDGYNVVTNDIIKLPLLDVLYFNPKILNSKYEQKWNDSSGAAFHTNSLDLMDSAFLEFIERQSLVYNWLTKSPGELISLDRFQSNEKIRNISYCLKGYFDQIDIFEISISSFCYVVLTLATGEHYKSVGLSADWNLEKAIYGSMKETWQLVSQFIPKHFQELYPTELLEPVAKQFFKSKNLYYERFQELSSSQLQEELSYLNVEPHKKRNRMPLDLRPNIENYMSTLKDISNELSIEILIAYIPSIIENIPGSVIRVMGKGAFPHIKTDELDTKLFSINKINELSYIQVPNRGKMVPFA